DRALHRYAPRPVPAAARQPGVGDRARLPPVRRPAGQVQRHRRTGRPRARAGTRSERAGDVTDPIEFDPVDAIGAGAFGQPGARTFVIQARKGAAVLSVLVEKEQVALLASEAEQFLDKIAEEHPEEPGTFGELADSGAVEEDEPLFRARLIGIGFDPERSLVLLELREQAPDQAAP